MCEKEEEKMTTTILVTGICDPSTPVERWEVKTRESPVWKYVGRPA